MVFGTFTKFCTTGHIFRKNSSTLLNSARKIFFDNFSDSQGEQLPPALCSLSRRHYRQKLVSMLIRRTSGVCAYRLTTRLQRAAAAAAAATRDCGVRFHLDDDGRHLSRLAPR